MTKLTRFLIVAAILGSMAGGTYAAWFFHGKGSGSSKLDSPARIDYDRLVAQLGGNEPSVRDDLNVLISSASSPIDDADRAKADRLTRECLDAEVLLAIEHVREFVGPAGRGDVPAYHFVSAAHRQHLRAIAGDNPSAERVLVVRKALAKLGEDFGLIRQPPDWKVDVVEKEGPPPPLPFLDLLRSGPTFLPASKHPVQCAQPRIPAFAGPDGELLVQLERFFNTSQARAALPPAKFPKLYKDDRIAPIPTNLFDYQSEIQGCVGEEMRILLPGENPDPEGIEAVKEVYGKLQRFFTAVVQFPS